MKQLTIISVCLNLGLAGGLIFLVLNGQRQKADSEPQIVVETLPPVKKSGATASQKPVEAKPNPFRWSQLETNDYHVFVRNLRAIGCPETTIRAIVTADVDTIYHQRAAKLEKKLEELNQGSWSVQLSSFDEQQALKARMQQLPGEEAVIIDEFLGLKTATGAANAPMASTGPPMDSLANGSAVAINQASLNQATIFSSTALAANANKGIVMPAGAADAANELVSSSKPPGIGQLPPKPASASLPLVFQPVDPAEVNFSQSQQQTVNDLRQQFVNSVSSSTQGPEDPAYQQTWLQAQTRSDEMTIVQLGYNAYMDYWLAQYQKSLASQWPASR